MKTIILKEKLKEGIGIVEKVSSRIVSLPILNNILITGEKSFLRLTATDLEIGISWWSLAKIEKEGKIAVPSRILSSFVSLLPNKQVKLDVKDLTLKIECESYETSIKGFNADEFPIIPNVSSEEKVSIKSKTFCHNLSQVVDIANYSSTKPEISGVYFLFQKNCITMAATDSFRLGEKKIRLSQPLGITKDYSFILPQRSAKEIINIFGEKEESLTILFGPNQILLESPLSEVSHPQVQLVSRLIEGEYPNYQEIIPKKYETKIIVPAQEFINQIKMAALFGGKANEVKLSIDPKKGQIDISSQSQDVGEHKSFLSGKAEGRPYEASFNHRFLLDGLMNAADSSNKNSEIVLELAGSEKPGVIRKKEDESYLYLVMPIKAN